MHLVPRGQRLAPVGVGEGGRAAEDEPFGELLQVKAKKSQR